MGDGDFLRLTGGHLFTQGLHVGVALFSHSFTDPSVVDDVCSAGEGY